MIRNVAIAHAVGAALALLFLALLFRVADLFVLRLGSKRARTS